MLNVDVISHNSISGDFLLTRFAGDTGGRVLKWDLSEGWEAASKDEFTKEPSSTYMAHQDCTNGVRQVQEILDVTYLCYSHADTILQDPSSMSSKLVEEGACCYCKSIAWLDHGELYIQSYCTC